MIVAASVEVLCFRTLAGREPKGGIRQAFLVRLLLVSDRGQSKLYPWAQVQGFLPDWPTSRRAPLVPGGPWRSGDQKGPEGRVTPPGSTRVPPRPPNAVLGPLAPRTGDSEARAWGAWWVGWAFGLVWGLALGFLAGIIWG